MGDKRIGIIDDNESMAFANDDGCGHDVSTSASSATSSEASIPPMSIVGKILQDAERDLGNSEWPGVMGTVLHPLRDTLWLPPLRFFNQHVAPVATSALPSTIDHAAGAVVGVTSGAIKFTYGIFPHIPSLDEFAIQEIETTSVLTFNRLPSRDSVSDAISQLFSFFGFVLNSVLDLLTNPAQKYSAFLNTIKIFVAFLMRTGITNEISNAIATRNAVTDMMLVARIQASLDDHRRADVAFRTPPLTPEEEMRLLQESKRHLQYATAAYGTFQISASETLPHQQQQQQQLPLTAAGIFDDAMDQLQKKFKKRIAKYLGLAEEDILYMTSPGEELSVIPHFVAIEKTSKSLILAIRGTNSLTDVFTDIDASTIEFCAGVAHKGMADLAINLLQSQDTMRIIDTTLTDHADFRLILIGHSLGAGVASLVCIKLHFDGHELVRQDREVRCIGFGCPPVFGAPVSSPCMKGMVGFQRVKTALSKIVCFINRHDVVPFLSVDAIRRLAHMLERVNTLTQTMNPIELGLIMRGMKAPPREMVQIVEDGSQALPQVGGAERLKIPGRFVLWMDDAPKSDDAEWYTGNSVVVCCRPSDLSNLAIRLSDQFIADHMPPRYEVRIKDLLS